MKASKAQRKAQHGRKDGAEGANHNSPAGSKILAAIGEATAVLRSEGLDSQRLTIHTYRVAPAPRSYGPEDVKRVRELLGTSQAVLASFLGVNINTVRSWEQGKRLPQPVACRFLSEIEHNPAYWRQRLGREPVETGSQAANGHK